MQTYHQTRLTLVRFFTLTLSMSALLLSSCSKEPQTSKRTNAPANAAAPRASDAEIVAAIDAAMGVKTSPPPALSTAPNAMPPSQEMVLTELKRAYARQLPPFLLVKQAPFEVIDASTAPSYRLKGKVVIEALEATFSPLSQITNDLGKTLTVAKPVLPLGETFEAPFTMEVVSAADGIRLSPPPLGRSVADLGVPLSALMNAFDSTSDAGQRIAAAGPRIKALDDEIYRLKHSPRKLALDALRELLENNQDERLFYDNSPTRTLYPELGTVADGYYARITNRGDASERNRQGRLFRKEFEKRFEKDYAAFYADLRNREQEFAELKNYLNSL